MYGNFLKYIHEKQLFDHADKLLIGVSGGGDSVVLANLVNRIGNPFAIAHCNFNLRGEESDDDEKFVVNLADSLGVKCFLSSFATREYAASKGISIEMAARELRYNWFEKIREENGFQWILVAHHLDDVLETVILNLSRGTGIRGLSGIKPIAGKIIRPLLFASRSEIEEYAQLNELTYRHDASNDDIHIKRNRVRHHILPMLEELNPSFRKNLQRTIVYLNETKEVYLHKMEQVRNDVVYIDGDWTKIDMLKLKEHQPLSAYLFELLRPFHFNSDVIEEIVQALESLSGLQFFSSTHRLVIDRDYLIITPLQTEKSRLYYIDKNIEFIHEPLHLRITIERYHPEYDIPHIADVAVFDFDTLRFPLILRHWQQGEYFKPLGMKGFKKLSDFFVDEKFSIPEKENTWILASENKVAWIVGKRIDDRFKLTSASKLVLRMEIMNAENA